MNFLEQISYAAQHNTGGRFDCVGLLSIVVVIGLVILYVNYKDSHKGV